MQWIGKTYGDKKSYQIEAIDHEGNRWTGRVQMIHNDYNPLYLWPRVTWEMENA